jgi:hypothetical protein
LSLNEFRKLREYGVRNGVWKKILESSFADLKAQYLHVLDPEKWLVDADWKKITPHLQRNLTITELVRLKAYGVNNDLWEEMCKMSYADLQANYASLVVGKAPWLIYE